VLTPAKGGKKKGVKCELRFTFARFSSEGRPRGWGCRTYVETCIQKAHTRKGRKRKICALYPFSKKSTYIVSSQKVKRRKGGGKATGYPSAARKPALLIRAKDCLSEGGKERNHACRGSVTGSLHRGERKHGSPRRGGGGRGRPSPPRPP